MAFEIMQSNPYLAYYCGAPAPTGTLSMGVSASPSARGKSYRAGPGPRGTHGVPSRGAGFRHFDESPQDYGGEAGDVAEYDAFNPDAAKRARSVAASQARAAQRSRMSPFDVAPDAFAEEAARRAAAAGSRGVGSRGSPRGRGYGGLGSYLGWYAPASLEDIAAQDDLAQQDYSPFRPRVQPPTPAFQTTPLPSQVQVSVGQSIGNPTNPVATVSMRAAWGQ